MIDHAWMLAEPARRPPLGPNFRPAALATRVFRDAARASGDAVPLLFALEREDGDISRFETEVFGEGDERASSNCFQAERLLKFLIWQRGAFRIHAAGPKPVLEHLAACYRSGGARGFDCDFLGTKVYHQQLEILPCAIEDVPPSREPGKSIGRHLDGCRIGFDLGASDRKVSAVIDGKVVFSEEVVWVPRDQTDPNYHYNEVKTAILTAAKHMPRLDAIGGSSAGVYVADQPQVASLFRGIPAERFDEVRHLFIRLGKELGVPLTIINDGDVAALAGSMALKANGILGIALGSSEAGGYVDEAGKITGWLNELAFCPIDYSPEAPEEEWSGDFGVGARYLSQQCVFRLAPEAGIALDPAVTDAARLKSVQARLEAGHEGALNIWRSMGIYLGYAVAHYANFYDFEHVLVLGRCTSGRGGALLVEESEAVLRAEFPELAEQVAIQLPDEESRRVGQAIAAASLPVIA